MSYAVNFYGFNGAHNDIEAIVDGLNGGSNVCTRRRAKYNARRAFDALIEMIRVYHPEYIIEGIKHHNGSHRAIVRERPGEYPNLVMVWIRKCN